MEVTNAELLEALELIASNQLDIITKLEEVSGTNTYMLGVLIALILVLIFAVTMGGEN